MLYLGHNSHCSFSLNGMILICRSGAQSSDSFLTIAIKPQSLNNVAIVLRLSKSFDSKFDFLPSNRNNSLKWTIKYLPCLCSIWQD